jgi:hypothetical protein
LSVCARQKSGRNGEAISSAPFTRHDFRVPVGWLKTVARYGDACRLDVLDKVMDICRALPK